MVWAVCASIEDWLPNLSSTEGIMVRPFALVLSIESHSSNKILRNNTQQSTYIIINVGPGGGVEHIMDGVEEYYTLSTQQSTICWKWLEYMSWKTQEFGLQLGAKDDGSSIGSAEHVLGEGGSGSNTNLHLHLICVLPEDSGSSSVVVFISTTTTVPMWNLVVVP